MKRLLVLLLFVMVALASRPVSAAAPVVHAVLFYSPTCPHCQKVMTEVLPPLQEQYGDQLLILKINVTQESGTNLYRTAVEALQIPGDHIGVPTLVVGQTYLVGSREIPEQFPALIATGLEQGGIPWPDLPGLEQEIAAQGLRDPADSTFWQIAVQKFMQDPLANTLAVIVLIVLLGTLVVSLGVVLSSKPTPILKGWHTAVLALLGVLGIPSVLDLLHTSGIEFGLAAVTAVILLAEILVPGMILFGRGEHPVARNWRRWAIPLLAVAGIIVASYLAFIEASQGVPLCGPVGDCGAVQASPYAVLFGILPVGVLGVIGYAAILVVWGVQQFGPARFNPWGDQAIWGMAVFGVLFSTYLTFLEPFVIGATCMWCITSAVLMALLLWVSTPAAKEALALEDSADEIEMDEDEEE